MSPTREVVAGAVGVVSALVTDEGGTVQSYGSRGGGWQGKRRPNRLVMMAGIVVGLLILVLAGIGLVSLLSGDDDSSPATTTTLPELTTTMATTTVPPTTTTTEPAATHVVESGDSLFSIAEKYGVDLAALIAANPQINDPEDIDIGDVINIPAADAAVSTDSAETGGTTAP